MIETTESMFTPSVQKAITGAIGELRESWPEMQSWDPKRQEARAYELARAWVPASPIHVLELAKEDLRLIKNRYRSLEPDEPETPLDQIRTNVHALFLPQSLGS